MAKITDITAVEILDSRGKPTIEVKVTTDDGIMASDSVPSGTSTGSFEAKALEPKIAVENVNNIIKPALLDMDPKNQEEIDRKMLELDGTENKSSLGANAILGVSLAVARTAALTEKIPLYMYLNQLYEKITKVKVEPSIPTPMMVMIEGGKHGENNLCMQEFLVISELENGRKIWNTLKELKCSNAAHCGTIMLFPQLKVRVSISQKMLKSASILLQITVKLITRKF